MLPVAFGKLHPKYKSPWAAIVLVGIICSTSPLLGKNALIWFVDLSAFCALFAYCCVCISFLLLRIREPDLHRPFRLKLGMAVGCICTLFSVIYLIIAMHDALNSVENGISILFVLAWMILGFILVTIAKMQYGDVSKQEREILIFGEKLARRNL